MVKNEINLSMSEYARLGDMPDDDYPPLSYIEEAEKQIIALRAELAAAREIVDAARPIAQHGTCATREEILNLVGRFAAIDAARRAGGEG